MSSAYLTRRVRSHEEVTAQIRVNVLNDAFAAYMGLRTQLVALKASERSDSKAEEALQEFLNQLDNAYADSLEGEMRIAEGLLEDERGEEYALERSVIRERVA